MNYKTTEYLSMKNVLDSFKFQMLRRVDHLRECNIPEESNVQRCVTPSVRMLVRFWADSSLLSLAVATRWNPKHSSYVNTRLFRKSYHFFLYVVVGTSLPDCLNIFIRTGKYHQGKGNTLHWKQTPNLTTLSSTLKLLIP